MITKKSSAGHFFGGVNQAATNEQLQLVVSKELPRVDQGDQKQWVDCVLCPWLICSDLGMIQNLNGNMNVYEILPDFGDHFFLIVATYAES